MRYDADKEIEKSHLFQTGNCLVETSCYKKFSLASLDIYVLAVTVKRYQGSRRYHSHMFVTSKISILDYQRIPRKRRKYKDPMRVQQKKSIKK